MKKEADIARLEDAAMQAYERPGHPRGLSYPECNGTLFEIKDGEIVRYR
jgi:two-component system chemotaxis response regulator CheB